jgi:hypothetical protein
MRKFSSPVYTSTNSQVPAQPLADCITSTGIGAELGVAENSGDKGSFLHESSSAKPAAVGAVLGAVQPGGAGAAIGYATDLFAGPLIYRR